MLSIHKHTLVPSQAAQEQIDIDVTPVMNMFIILIPFLVSMAVFTHLSIVEFSLPPNVGTNLDSSDGKPKLKLTAVIDNQYVLLTLGDTLLDSIPALDSEIDFSALLRKVITHRNKIDIQDEMIVAVKDAVPVRKVIGVMDIGRDAGFGKIGLSTAETGE